MFRQTQKQGTKEKQQKKPHSSVLINGPVFYCVAGRLKPIECVTPSLRWFLSLSLEFCQGKMSRMTASQLRRQGIFSGSQGGTEHKGHTTPELLLKI